MTDNRDEQRERYRQGLPDYHDPTAGIGGAPPAQSALTLRLVLAIFGLLLCGTATGIAAATGALAVTVVFAVLAAAALVDIMIIVRRKRRGEPG